MRIRKKKIGNPEETAVSGPEVRSTETIFEVHFGGNR
jgi:hypothetical protein